MTKRKRANTTEKTKSASYLDLHMNIDSDDQLRVKHFTIKEMV